MNSNDDKQQQLSIFPPNDPRGVPEAKIGAVDGVTAEQLIEAAKNSVGPAGDRVPPLKAANSRQFPPIDQTSSENATDEAAKTRQFPPDRQPNGDDESANDDQSPPVNPVRRRPVHPNYRRGRERLLWELAHDATLIEAAERAGLGERTAQRYWSDDSFKSEVLELRCQMYWKTTGQLAMNLDQATQTLAESLKSNSEWIRIAAAQAIFRFAREMGSQQQQNKLLEDKLNAIVNEIRPPEEGFSE